MALEGPLAEVMALGRLAGTPRLLGDSQEAQPHPAPGVPRLCAHPEAVRESLPKPAASLLKQQGQKSLPGETFSLGPATAGQSIPAGPPLLFANRV